MWMETTTVMIKMMIVTTTVVMIRRVLGIMKKMTDTDRMKIITIASIVII